MGVGSHGMHHCFSKQTTGVALAVIGLIVFLVSASIIQTGIKQEKLIQELRSLNGIVETDGNLVDRLFFDQPIWYIDLRGTEVQDEHVKWIATEFPDLTHLYLDNTAVTDVCVEDILRMRCLRRLTLRGTCISSTGRTTIAHHVKDRLEVVP